MDQLNNLAVVEFDKNKTLASLDDAHKSFPEAFPDGTLDTILSRWFTEATDQLEMFGDLNPSAARSLWGCCCESVAAGVPVVILETPEAILLAKESGLFEYKRGKK